MWQERWENKIKNQSVYRITCLWWWEWALISRKYLKCTLEWTFVQFIYAACNIVKLRAFAFRLLLRQRLVIIMYAMTEIINGVLFVCFLFHLLGDNLWCSGPFESTNGRDTIAVGVSNCGGPARFRPTVLWCPWSGRGTFDCCTRCRSMKGSKRGSKWARRDCAVAEREIFISLILFILIW